MTSIWNNHGGFNWEGKDPNLSPTFAVFYNTIEYGQTVRWEMMAGRNFSREYPSDSLGIVLNESAVRYMGLKNPIGAKVRFAINLSDPVFLHVIGVVKDVVMQSPFTPVKQAIYMLDRYDMGNVVTVRINPGLSASQAIPQMAAIFKQIDPNVPFDYYFADLEYAKKFALEERIGKLAAFFAALAILISCLGLFGLASFVAEQRIKEIGVRKVLGATVVQLWMLLSRDFLWLVGLSFLIALPVESGDERLAPTLSLSGDDLVVGVCGDDGGGNGHYAGDGELAGGAGRPGESGQISSNRINSLYAKELFPGGVAGAEEEPGISVINVVGLAIGLAVCMLIALYVTHELSYDRYHVNADRIYRLDADLKVGAMGYYSWDSPLPLGPALVKDFPDVETMARVNISPTMLVKKEDQTILEEHAGWADPSLFDVFTLPMLAGNPKTALAEPNTMVISERMAEVFWWRRGGDGEVHVDRQCPNGQGDGGNEGYARDFSCAF